MVLAVVRMVLGFCLLVRGGHRLKPEDDDEDEEAEVLILKQLNDSIDAAFVYLNSHSMIVDHSSLDWRCRSSWICTRHSVSMVKGASLC